MHLRALNPGDYVALPFPLSALFGDDDDRFYVMGVPGDGSCLLHAILSALSAEYCVGYSIEAKQQHALRLRRTLSSLLERGEWLPADGALQTHYRTVVQRELRDTSAFLGQEVASILSDHYNVNIFMIQLSDNGRLALLPEFTKIHPARPSMVLLARQRHFEPIMCVQQRNDRLTGTFAWHDSIVHRLRMLYVLCTRYSRPLREHALDFAELCTWSLRQLFQLHHQLSTAASRM